MDIEHLMEATDSGFELPFGPQLAGLADSIGRLVEPAERALVPRYAAAGWWWSSPQVAMEAEATLRDAEVYDVLDVSFRGGSHRDLGHDALGLLGAADVDISEFVLSKRGVDVVEQSYLTMKHDGDEVVLRVAPPFQSATFSIATRNKVMKRSAFGKVKGVKSDKTETKTITVPQGKTHTVKVSEGRQNLTLRRDEQLDQDVTVTLISAMKEPENPGEEPSQLWSQSGGGGSGLSTSTEQALKYAAMGLGVVGVGYLAYLFASRRSAPAPG